MFCPIAGHEYHQVLVVDTEGEYVAGGGYTTEIPQCLDTAELRKKCLSLLPQGRGKCPDGCHDILVLEETGISIYLASADWNVN